VFTGIIQCVGSITRLEKIGGDVRLALASPRFELDDVALGDSIAVSGVCLTVVDRGSVSLAFDVSNETLARTTLGQRVRGDRVNLEKALRLGDRLGGHVVTGHVDGIGRVAAIADDGRAQRWRFMLPQLLARYVAEKGSICVDGVSLTVNTVGTDWFNVALIPHTIAVTTFANRHAGDVVNIEVDVIARYVERLAGNS
jgi:riboflavin synthase